MVIKINLFNKNFFLKYKVFEYARIIVEFFSLSF